MGTEFSIKLGKIVSGQISSTFEDSTGIAIQNDIYITGPQPKSFILAGFVALKYNLSKQFSLQLELDNGLYYSFNKGTRVMRYETIRNTGINSSSEYNTEVNFQEARMFFLEPSISVKYQFK